MDFDLLPGAEVTAELSCYSGSVPVENIIEADTVDLTGVRLQTLGAVPDAAPTWGGLKAGYLDGNTPR